MSVRLLSIVPRATRPTPASIPLSLNCYLYYYSVRRSSGASACAESMTRGDTEESNELGREKSNSAAGLEGSAGSGARHPRRLIFAPGDIAAPPSSTTAPTTNITPVTSGATISAQTNTHPSPLPKLVNNDTDNPNSSDSGTSTPSANAAVVAHPSRAHQFMHNPPLTFAQLDAANPLHQFHAWFRDSRLLPASAPETCTLATAALPSGRVSARIVYLKELDERGWVVYSNWGSRAGKGGQVFGTGSTSDSGSGGMGGNKDAALAGSGSGGDNFVEPDDSFAPIIPDDFQDPLQGNRWAALTFHWPSVERQVRIEGLIEPLRRDESETYWRVRERGSQIGAWASQQSKVLWSTDPRRVDATSNDTTTTNNANDEADDGRSVLEGRVQEMEKWFADTEDIPLPPFWGGVRLVPESVEFWQGRKSRLHDRFRYVRVHSNSQSSEEQATEKNFRWRIQRLSP